VVVLQQLPKVDKSFLPKSVLDSKLCFFKTK
jgi:hypothetical protein